VGTQPYASRRLALVPNVIAPTRRERYCQSDRAEATAELSGAAGGVLSDRKAAAGAGPVRALKGEGHHSKQVLLRQLAERALVAAVVKRLGQSQR
jgi:hypothetical protein